MWSLGDPGNDGFFFTLWCESSVNYGTVDSGALLHLKNYLHSVVVEVRCCFGQFCCWNLSGKLFNITLIAKTIFGPIQRFFGLHVWISSQYLTSTKQILTTVISKCRNFVISIFMSCKLYLLLSSSAYINNYSVWRQTRNNYILITNLMHWLLFIHKILFSSTCFELQALIFRRIQLYTCSIWYCHSLWEFLVACRYTAWVRTQAVYQQGAMNCDSTICCMSTTVSSWRWALEARNT